MRTTIGGGEDRLPRPAGPERFGPAELEGLPEPARRHRFAEGEFFRYRITELQPLGPAGGPEAGPR